MHLLRRRDATDPDNPLEELGDLCLRELEVDVRDHLDLPAKLQPRLVERGATASRDDDPHAWHVRGTSEEVLVDDGGELTKTLVAVEDDRERGFATHRSREIALLEVVAVDERQEIVELEARHEAFAKEGPRDLLPHAVAGRCGCAEGDPQQSTRVAASVDPHA
ncbi:hypothetical protein ACFPRL_24040 [Pseudoclavibacter helvolus]